MFKKMCELWYFKRSEKAERENILKRLENKNSKMYKIFNIEEINKLLDENDENDILPWYRSTYDEASAYCLSISV